MRAIAGRVTGGDWRLAARQRALRARRELNKGSPEKPNTLNQVLTENQLLSSVVIICVYFYLNVTFLNEVNRK
jgi:hypothetical protein